MHTSATCITQSESLADTRIYFTEVHNGLQRSLDFKNDSLAEVIYIMIRFKKTVFSVKHKEY